jgi:NTE family protein
MTSVSRALVLFGGGGRGSYQAGVWAWLEEQGWKPDLVSGSSVGAINGAAIASGMSAAQLKELWYSIDGAQVFRRRRWRNFAHWLKRLFGYAQGFAPLADTSPLRELLTQKVDMAAVRASETELVVTAVRILDAAVRYFEGRRIGIEHLMASSAIPVVFPWEEIDGEAYWDGGLAVNTPLLPAIQRSAREVVVVLFVPIARGLSELPATRRRAIEWIFEVATLASAESIVSLLLTLQGEAPLGEARPEGTPIMLGQTRLLPVAPAKPLGLHSLLHFEPKQTELLFEAGYSDARDQLSSLLE